MSAEIKIFFEIAEKIFSKTIDHTVRINNSYDNRKFVELLNELKKSELTKILMKEEFGGANLCLGEIVPLIKLSSKYGLPLPFSENFQLFSWIFHFYNLISGKLIKFESIKLYKNLINFIISANKEL